MAPKMSFLIMGGLEQEEASFKKFPLNATTEKELDGFLLTLMPGAQLNF